jgi:hypothetical protein
MSQGWKSLVTTDSLSVFNKDEDNWELPTSRVPSDVPSLEEPITDPSSWKELKDATLSGDCMKKVNFFHIILLLILLIIQ